MNHSRLNKIASFLNSVGLKKEANQIKSFAQSSLYLGGPDEGAFHSETMDKVVLALKDLFKSLPEVKGSETTVCKAVAKAAGITDEEWIQEICSSVMDDINKKRRFELDETQRTEIDRPFDVEQMLADESERAREKQMIEDYEEREGSTYTPSSDISGLKMTR